jgi:hypothetical protein
MTHSRLGIKMIAEVDRNEEQRRLTRLSIHREPGHDSDRGKAAGHSTLLDQFLIQLAESSETRRKKRRGDIDGHTQVPGFGSK